MQPAHDAWRVGRQQVAAWQLQVDVVPAHRVAADVLDTAQQCRWQFA